MKTYEESNLLRTRDCDVNGEWRFSAILETLQETAGGHCDRMGCGRRDLIKSHIAWVLIRSEVHMDRYPVIGERVYVETFHTPVRHRLFPRYFLIRDNQRQMIGKASTLWTLIDIRTRKTIAADWVAAKMPDNSDMKAPMSLPTNILAPEKAQREEVIYHPSYTDLDANGHMNNAKYADLLCNLLGTEAMRRSKICSMILNFNAEVLPDEAIPLVLERGQQQCRLTGENGARKLFEIGCYLKERSKEKAEKGS